MRVDDVLDDLDAHVDGNDHFEFFWVPHTGWALTKTNNRTTEPLAPRGRVAEWWNDYCSSRTTPSARSAGSDGCRPQWIPRLAKALPAAGPGHLRRPELPGVRQPSPRPVLRDGVRHPPRGVRARRSNRIRRFVEDAGLLLNFPVEVRFTAAGRHPAVDRERAGVVLPRRPRLRGHGATAPTSKGVERIMDDYDGRPHWGKLHFQTAATLADALRAVGPVPRRARPRRSGAALRQRLPGPGARAPERRSVSWRAARRLVGARLPPTSAGAASTRVVGRDRHGASEPAEHDDVDARSATARPAGRAPCRRRRGARRRPRSGSGARAAPARATSRHSHSKLMLRHPRRGPLDVADEEAERAARGHADGRRVLPHELRQQHLLGRRQRADDDPGARGAGAAQRVEPRWPGRARGRSTSRRSR